MKKSPLHFKIIVSLVLLMIVALSCDNDDATKPIDAYFEILPGFFQEDELLGNGIDSLKVKIETNSYWAAEKQAGEDNDWFSIKPLKGTGDGEVFIEVDENPTIDIRSAWVYFNAFKHKDSLRISQRGQVLSISETSFENISSEGDELLFTLSSTFDWIAGKDDKASWLELDSLKGGAGKHEMKLVVKKNEADSVRTDSISFSTVGGVNNSKLWLKVSQKNKEEEPPVLVLDSTDLDVAAVKGEVKVKLNSNIDWVAKTEAKELIIEPQEGTAQKEPQEITITYPENKQTDSRVFEVLFFGKETNESVKEKLVIRQTGMAIADFEIKNDKIDVDGRNQMISIELSSSTVDWKAVSNNSKFVITENSSGTATTNPVEIKVNIGENMSFDQQRGIIEIQKADDPSVKREIIITQGLHPLNDESAVYANPNKTASQLGLDRGVAHPNKEEWQFWNAHEFDENPFTTFWGFNTRVGIKNAIFDPDMNYIEDGILRLTTKKLDQPQNNMHGDPAEFVTGPLYSKRHHQQGVKWVKFTTNMRVEVRYRNSGHEGFNYAIWFMGQSNYDSQKIPWPDNGEIDLTESPVRNESHVTLHTKNFSSENNNAVTESVKLADETKWNIYWIEILEDRIISGINGFQFFEHKRGDGGNNDWPWDNPAGMMMIITPGIGGWGNALPNLSPGEEAFMEIDWIRVYTNNKFDESTQQGHDGKFY